MKNNGFSLVEILIAIFVIAAIISTMIPTKVVEKSQVERIAEWKEFYPSLLYSFDLFKNYDKSVVKAYQTDSKLDGNAFFSEYTKYLNVNKNADINLSKYKLRYLNGKAVKNTSKYKISQIVQLEDGKIIAFTDLERDKDNISNSPLGIIFVDIDGGKLTRHYIGKDVFAINIYANRIEPVGKNYSRPEMKEDCSPLGTGMNCSAYYLFGGVM
jgi:prepilin-type N-terminal cleavage/methylation domain-containing protein